MRAVVATFVIATIAAIATASLHAGVAGHANAAAAPPGMTLKRVVFAHRHGARTPVINVNGSCDRLGCGTLTDEGAKMLHSLGETFRSMYGSILPDEYHARHITTVSDESARVIQSASAFLEGLFAYNASAKVYPATDTTYKLIIDPWARPGAALHQVTVAENTITNISKKVLDTIISRSDIVAIGKEMGLNDLECDVVPQLCMAKEVDFLNSMVAAGRVAEYPLGQQLLPKLNEAMLLLFHTMNFLYDNVEANTTYFADAGYPGAPLFDGMLDSAEFGTPLTELSGHDTTLMPLWTAMGNYTWSYPDFATAFIYEVYGPSGSDAAKDLFLVPRLGRTVQTPGDHPYTIEPYAAKCQKADGTVYVTEAGCPLEDLRRVAAAAYGKNGNAIPGGCYAWPKDLADNLCTGQKTDAKMPCGKYRAACPFYACGAGKYMTPELECVAV